MPSENTQYGLKNKLTATQTEKLSKNLYRISLDHPNNKKLFLFILVLSDTVIRFHYRFEDNFEISKPNSHLGFDNFKAQKTEEESHGKDFVIQTNEIKISINKYPLQISIYNSNGDLISEDVPELGFWSKELDHTSLHPSPFTLHHHSEIRCYQTYPDLKHPPKIYGLGDKTGSINRWGRRFRNAPIDALGYDGKFTDPLYKDIPFFIHFNPQKQKAHGIFFDNFYPKFFDFGKERKPYPYYYFGADGGELNYYFIYGPKIKDIISQYLELSGKPVLMPKFSFGYLASGMSYTENYGDTNNQDQKLLEAFKRFKNKKIPTSAFHLSSGYILNDENKRHQFIWNQAKFPSAKEFASEAQELGVELTANVKPVLLTSHPWYQEAKEAGLFIKNKAGETLVIDYWGGSGSYMDFTNPKTKSWWISKLKTYILDNGIRGIWNDNNEYEIFEDHQCYGKETEMSLLMSELAYTASLEADIKLRPWILSRSGFAGIQRYAQTWTGDNYSSWKALKYDNAIISSMGLSGLIHTGSDIGGFAGDTPDYELLTRWIQNGVFTPRFCIHSYKEIPTEPDMYSETHVESFKIIQEFINLRYKLMPYIYQANYQASTIGKPIQRPLIYDYQDDPNTYEESFAYMFGNSLLIAPVYKSAKDNESERKVYLPQGNNWINFFTYQEYGSGKTIKERIKLNTIPVYVKANSVIAFEAKANTLELRVFLDSEFFGNKSKLEYFHYEDDGNSFDYLKGEYLLSKFVFSTNGKVLEAEINAEEGHYISPYQEIIINVIHRSQSKKYQFKRYELKARKTL